MEKQIVTADSVPCPSVGAWLDLETCARVRLTSEHSGYPIEFALRGDSAGERGWKATQPGPQTIWLHFEHPQPIEQVHVRFEAEERRTQEFALLWSSDDGITYHDLVRQQFNFSPGSASHEDENYFPHLRDVTDLKLTIVPDISGGDTCASLRALRVA